MVPLESAGSIRKEMFLLLFLACFMAIFFCCSMTRFLASCFFTLGRSLFNAGATILVH